MPASAMASQMLFSLFSSDAKAKFARKVLPVPEPESAGDGNPIEGPDSSANARDSDDDNEEDVENKDFGSAEEMEARFAEDQGHTLFVGNVALTAATTKVLKRIFSPFGEIQSIRIRSLPIAGTKVDEAGNQNLVKKVCAQKLILGTQKGSANAYIKFAEQGSIAKAMKEIDNTVVEGRHLRVDKLPPSLLDNQTTVFVGNLPRLADEEELRDFFAQRLAGGQEVIKCVRLVRDKETMEGRGFGYVQLSSRQVAAQALGLNSEKFKDKHALRIRKCMDQERQAKDKGSQGSQQHHGHSKFSPSSHPRRLSSQSGGTTSASSSRPSSSTSSSSSVPVSVNAKHALKRLKKKAASTKKKLQSQNKNKKPKAHKTQRKTK